ncbi:MAG TPA: hypothetical protein VIK71_10805 [Flavobacteriales bacterium]
MNNTEILIVKTQDRNVTNERKYGIAITNTDDVETALNYVLQRHFDVLILDDELPAIEKTRMTLLSNFHLPQLIVLVSKVDDKDFAQSIHEGIRKKTLRNLGHIEWHEQN